MKALKVLVLSGATSVVIAGAVSTPALAWHPDGKIKKYVRNITTNSVLADADLDSDAVAAKPGDILEYVIEIRNDGAQGQTNEMHFTKMTDELPAGVELVSDSSKRTLSEEFGDKGVIKPGEKDTKSYRVKVTSNKNEDLITNKACFTGDSEVKDNPQNGCDEAKVKVAVPKTPEQPKPEQPKPEQKPEVLPITGASAVLAPFAALGSGVAAYAGRLLVIKRRQK